MNISSKIAKVFSKRKTGMTSEDVAARIGAHKGSVRKVLARDFAKVGTTVNKTTGKTVSLYHLRTAS